VRRTSDPNIKKAIDLLTQGELVVIPTETVYGLAANAFDENAVDKIYALKKRPKTNPLILHISGEDELSNYVENVPDDAKKLIDHFWPGPLTLLLPKKKIVPKFITAGSEKVAVRVPNNAKTLELLRLLPFPIVAPSANPFTYISPTKPEHLRYCYGNAMPFILEDGECQEGIESTIIGFVNGIPTIYRLGAITLEEIEMVLHKTVFLQTNQNTSEEQTPGMHKKHYSPKTTVRIESIDSIKTISDPNFGFLTFSEEIKRSHSYFLGQNGLKEGAKKLYTTLYELDQLGLECILIESVPEIETGRTIMDRLRRSSH
jgi:L-threonylcarbamoyladenylate synthase